MDPTLTPGVVVGADGTRISICDIAALTLLGNATFTSAGLTFLNLPEPADTSCEGICESAIRVALNELLGTNVAIGTGGTTFTGTINQVFVGIVNQGNIRAITTCNIGFINP
ncbi:hypothetical protein [Neobacillus sp. D3-1R]|uniref:hypothetical protein n=1 Tax=Neobacillus sp. D3-1R TaxID=3445778 RepID=UPI003F9FF6A1